VKKHIDSPAPTALEGRKWRQCMWKRTQSRNLGRCCNHRQRQRILSFLSPTSPSLADYGSPKALLLQNLRHRWKGTKI